MSEPPPRPGRRVTVMHPRTAAVHRAPARPLARDLDEQTMLGDLLLRSLIRAQRGLALRIVGAVVVLVAGWPLLFAWIPRTRTDRLFGIPLPWLVLGILVYPLLIALGASYVRLARRNERDFIRSAARSRR